MTQKEIYINYIGDLKNTTTRYIQLEQHLKKCRVKTSQQQKPLKDFNYFCYCVAQQFKTSETTTETETTTEINTDNMVFLNTLKNLYLLIVDKYQKNQQQEFNSLISDLYDLNKSVGFGYNFFNNILQEFKQNSKKLIDKITTTKTDLNTNLTKLDNIKISRLLNNNLNLVKIREYHIFKDIAKTNFSNDNKPLFN